MLNRINYGTSRIRSLLCASAMALAILPSAAFAGTYSVIGIQWFPTTAPGVGTNGGAISFSGLDLKYSMAGDISAPIIGSPSQNGALLNPTVIGNWSWVVQWVGSGPSD